ncbi:MAG: transcription termination/antitermination protein NusG [Clostridia bacterium]|nr:transcription termination/antitermination protein NusG [Clostridia bacterium]
MEDMENINGVEPKWYILQTQFGYESIAESSLRQLVELNNLQDYILDIVVPEEEETVERNGKLKLVKHKKYPNYVFIKMVYTKQIWYMVRNTRGIKDFCSGYDGKPLPMSEEEVKRAQLEKVTIEDLDIKVGDTIKIMSGPLKDFIGEIKEIKADIEKVKVSVMMFGRETTVELDFAQIEKL